MILACDTAPEGAVRSLPAWQPMDFPFGSAILCRNTAPLVAVAFRLLRYNVPVQMLGRQLGTSLTALVKRLHANTIDELHAKLTKYEERERHRLLARLKFVSADALSDRCECLRIIIRNARSVDEVFEFIASLFEAPPGGSITLSTIHKAKGLEWKHVFLLDRHLIPSCYAETEWQIRQEINLLYVAVTRAKETLTYIKSK